MKFYSAWYCPFAQRAWITLLLKEIGFEYIEVDPYHKSSWWLTMSRGQAQVPVVVANNGNHSGETTIIDSTRVVEYLDDLVPAVHPILSSDPNLRAEQRHWMDHVNRKIVPYLYRFLQATEEDEFRQESRDQLISGLKTITSAMSGTGPFFNGAEIGAVDILLAPFAYRIDALLGHYREFRLPTEGDIWPRYHRWYQAILNDPVFKATSTDHENYRERLIEFYYPYSQGDGQKDVAQVS